MKKYQVIGLGGGGASVAEKFAEILPNIKTVTITDTKRLKNNNIHFSYNKDRIAYLEELMEQPLKIDFSKVVTDAKQIIIFLRCLFRY